VELTEHEHALAAVEALNNKSDVARDLNKGKRLMIDFALDDARVVRQRRIKQVVLRNPKASPASLPPHHPMRSHHSVEALSHPMPPPPLCVCVCVCACVVVVCVCVCAAVRCGSV
jgi:hypothetical protein